jgi:hypothetical protein
VAAELNAVKHRQVQYHAPPSGCPLDRAAAPHDELCHDTVNGMLPAGMPGRHYGA